MFMLTPSEVVEGCYSMAITDAATDGSSTQLMKNIWEAASVLDSWEVALPKAKVILAKFDQLVNDNEAEANVKHFYQTMRHGMSFDWMLNYVNSRILAVFPYSSTFEFSGTADFVNTFIDDEVFNTELAEIDKELNAVFDWVFEGYPDRTVYNRLAKISGSSVADALYGLSNLPSLGDGSPYVIPLATAHRVNYLNLLMEMFAAGIGYVKREVWHSVFARIKAGELDAFVVVGNKFEAFAYGGIGGTGIKWHRFQNGIKMMGLSDRQQRSEYIRAFADEMTFFRIQNDTLYVDETLFPQVSFDDGKTWFTANLFKDDASSLQVDIPVKMQIRYPFTPRYDDIGNKTIKLKGSTNCVFKDSKVLLDENNWAETQVVFRGQNVSFGITDADKKYPFSFFSTSSVSIDTLAWLK
jgi:hypothetical protein